MLTGNKRAADLAGGLQVDMVGRMEANYLLATKRSLYQNIPGLRAYWPLSGIGDAGNAVDASGQGRTLTLTGAPTYDRYTIGGAETYVTHAQFGGTADYFIRATEPGLEIRGTETYITANKRGLSMGVWAWFDNVGSIRNVMGKLGAAGQRSYFIQRTAANLLTFQVSVDGTALTAVNTSLTVSTGQWYYIGASYSPSSYLKLWVTDYSANGRKLAEYTNTTSIPASIFNSTAGFTLGVIATLANFFAGKQADGWLSAEAVPANWHEMLYEQGRPLYGV